jgi:hypothetical protein
VSRKRSRSTASDADDNQELLPLTDNLYSSEEEDVMLDGRTEHAPPDVPKNANGLVETEPDQTTSNGEHEFKNRYGFGKCKPDVIQVCNNPKALLVYLCWLSMIQGEYRI